MQDYNFSMENGNYTLEISKEGYVTNYKNITVAETRLKQQILFLYREMGTVKPQENSASY